MIIWRLAQVSSIGRSWPGAQEIEVRVLTGPAQPESVAPGAQVRALVYPELVGSPEIGDRVLITCSALARGLGTGGYALVAGIPDRLPPDPPPGPGHLMKARYTPLQTMVLGVDEQESDEHATLREANDLAGMPVVVADLHSALPAIVAGIHAEAAHQGAQPPRIGYIMTDGGALPAQFSRAVARLRESELIAGTITVGQAFGGDLEAVTLHTGLLAARHVLDADIAIVAQGPGNLGTGTSWGFSGVAAGEAINAAAVLGGRPIASLRVSQADPRSRHRGISHHSLTAYGRVALAGADVVLMRPSSHLSPQFCESLGRQAETLRDRHRLIWQSTHGLYSALSNLPVQLSTMGRSLQEDPSPFLAAAAAGQWAGRLLQETPDRVWHLALRSDWEGRGAGGYRVSTRGKSLDEVGFIHASRTDQVDAVADAFYSDVAPGDLIVLELAVDHLTSAGSVVVADPGDPTEPEGERYPHIYGPIVPDAVLRTVVWAGSIAESLAD